MMDTQEGWGLTPAQYDAMCVLQELMEGGRPAPSLEELARELDLKAKSAAKRLLDGLEARGWIARAPRRSRRLRILRRVDLPDFSNYEFFMKS
jgi:DNA-binding MarR family transcriptional regulator